MSGEARRRDGRRSRDVEMGDGGSWRAVHDEVLDRLVASNDLDELVREVDRRTDAADWGGLARLRDRCRSALERGFQLWPAASLAEYRLALRAPPHWAVVALAEGAGRFALGPLSEVVASTHTWDELAPHLAPGPLAGVVAHERVVRGEDLRTVGVPFADVFDLPLALEAWEPKWPLAGYRDHDLDAPRPALPPLRALRLPVPGDPHRDPEVEDALRAVVEPWVAQSNGRAATVGVRGGALEAVAALGVTEGAVAELEPRQALAQLGWAAASGGAHGRRRGAAAGRELAWRCLLALGGGEVAHHLRWLAFDENRPERGWTLRLAVEDPARDVAWAVAATDER